MTHIGPISFVLWLCLHAPALANVKATKPDLPPEENTYYSDIIAQKKRNKSIRLTEHKTPSDLKTKKVGDVFYASVHLIHPTVTHYPIAAFKRWFERQRVAQMRLNNFQLTYNNNRSYRDTNNPLNVIIGPDHQYLIYADNYFLLYHDIGLGAKAVPVKIIDDKSALHDPTLMWQYLIENMKAVAWASKQGGQVDSLKDVQNHPLMNTLDKYMAHVEYAQKKGQTTIAIHCYTPYPIALRLPSAPGQSDLVLHHIAPYIEKRILEDENLRQNPSTLANMFKKTNYPDLMMVLTQDNPSLSLDQIRRLKELLEEATRQGDFMYIRDFSDKILLIPKFAYVDDIDFHSILGKNDQILKEKHFDAMPKGAITEA